MGRVHWCGDSGDLERWLAQVGRGPVGIDSEADSLHHYPEKVCLVQISFGGVDLLIDPLAGVNLKRLEPLLADDGVRKVLHGADYDLRVLNRDFDLRVRGLFDTMIAARLVGERSFGLASLLERHFGVRLEKQHQRADWSRRPLPEPMREYAALDTRHLVLLAELLEARLEQLGRRSWSEEEFGLLEGVRWRPRSESEVLRKLSAGAELGRRGLGVLRELVNLRDRLAREADRPPFRILSNEILLRIARARPREPAQLEELVPGGRRRFRAWWPNEVLGATRRGLDLPESELPECRPRRGERPPDAVRSRLRNLVARREALARELDIESSLLASRALLQAMIRRELEGEDPGATPGLRRWQWAFLRSWFP